MKLFTTFVALMVFVGLFVASVIFLFDVLGLVVDGVCMFIQWISEKINGTDNDI